MNRHRALISAVALLALALAVAVVVALVWVLAPHGTGAAVPAEPSAAPTAVAAPSAAPSPPVGGVTTAGIAAQVDPAWVARVAARAGIPVRALAAYAGAALAVAASHPRCGLGWNTLAAIGSVESAHGTIGGARIDADGVARPAIVGIALDGSASARIADTDDGAVDGDAEWDRAVGPMQFIPSTWAVYGRDGDGDGRADIHQIDDAALSAAVYLCDVGGDLTDPARWIAAVHDYNPDAAYNHRVADAAARYASLG